MSKSKRTSFLQPIMLIGVLLCIIVIGYFTNQQYLQKTADQLGSQTIKNDQKTNQVVVTQLPVEAVESEQVLGLDHQPIQEYAQQVGAIADHYPNPTTPTYVAVKDLFVGQRAQVTWQIPVGQTCTGVEVYRSTTETPVAGDLLGEVPASQTYYLDTTVSNDTTYYYSVRSYRMVDQTKTYSEFSDVHSVIPTDSTAPHAPNQIVVAPDPTDPSQLAITWQTVSDQDVVWYQVYRSTSPATLGDKITHVTPDVTRVLDTTITPGRKYFYTVTAVDASGNESATQFATGAYGNASPFNQLANQ